jgi:hypothetical protein
VRMSFGLFNTEAEIDWVVEVLGDLAARGPRGSYRFDPVWGEYHADGQQAEIDPALGI